MELENLLKCFGIKKDLVEIYDGLHKKAEEFIAKHEDEILQSIGLPENFDIDLDKAREFVNLYSINLS